jgi:hypothetical protein
MAWSAGIGDPTWIGWLTTAGYFVAALLCFVAFPRDRIWLAIGLSMALLGFNKQLDLQTLLTQIGKQMALQEGWYDQRHQIQAAFAAAFVGLSGAGAVKIFFVARRESRALRLALAGTLVLMAFVVMRVATFEHLGMPDFGDNLNGLVELVGIACVAGGAWCSRFQMSRAVSNF